MEKNYMKKSEEMINNLDERKKEELSTVSLIMV
jgi:hypothetical protein